MPTPPEPPAEPPFDQLLHQPEVVAAIHRVLGKYGFRQQDLEDGHHTGALMALEWKGDRPVTLRGTKALCIVLAHRHGASVYRQLKRREKRGHAGLTDKEDTQFAFDDARFDVLDVMKLLELLARSVPGHTVEAFDDVAVGTPQKEIAADRGVPYEKVRDDLEKGRTKFRKAVILAGMSALLVAGAGWLLYAHGNATPHEEAQLLPGGPPSEILVQVKRTELAAKLRQEAADLCKAHRWEECSDALDRAYAMDREGDSTPAVNRLRDQADQGMNAKVNPGLTPTSHPSPKPAPTPK